MVMWGVRTCSTRVQVFNKRSWVCVCELCVCAHMHVHVETVLLHSVCSVYVHSHALVVVCIWCNVKLHVCHTYICTSVLIVPLEGYHLLCCSYLHSWVNTCTTLNYNCLSHYLTVIEFECHFSKYAFTLDQLREYLITIREDMSMYYPSLISFCCVEIGFPVSPSCPYMPYPTYTLHSTQPCDVAGCAMCCVGAALSSMHCVWVSSSPAEQLLGYVRISVVKPCTGPCVWWKNVKHSWLSHITIEAGTWIYCF